MASRAPRIPGALPLLHAGEGERLTGNLTSFERVPREAQTRCHLASENLVAIPDPGGAGPREGRCLRAPGNGELLQTRELASLEAPHRAPHGSKASSKACRHSRGRDAVTWRPQSAPGLSPGPDATPFVVSHRLPGEKKNPASREPLEIKEPPEISWAYRKASAWGGGKLLPTQPEQWRNLDISGT